MANSVQLGSVGVTFRRTIKAGGAVVDLSGATTKEIHFRPPKGGALRTEAAAFPTPGSGGYTGPGDGTDGVIEYVSVAAFLDISGTWRWQPFVVIGAQSLPGAVRTFDVGFNV